MRRERLSTDRADKSCSASSTAQFKPARLRPNVLFESTHSCGDHALDDRERTLAARSRPRSRIARASHRRARFASHGLRIARASIARASHRRGNCPRWCATRARPSWPRRARLRWPAPTSSSPASRQRPAASRAAAQEADGSCASIHGLSALADDRSGENKLLSSKRKYAPYMMADRPSKPVASGSGASGKRAAAPEMSGCRDCGQNTVRPTAKLCRCVPARSRLRVLIVQGLRVQSRRVLI